MHPIFSSPKPLSTWEQLGLAFIAMSCATAAVLYAGSGLETRVKISCGGGSFAYDHTPGLVAMLVAGAVSILATYVILKNVRRVWVKAAVFLVATAAPLAVGRFYPPTEIVLEAPTPRVERVEIIF